ncbi:MAG: carbamoyltransferase HypF [Nitrospiraceae bacterium]|nr:carbamoyltransferase HypF [Nitrospiraceae bacterium]
MGRISIRISGVVQGVGFRPYVYRLACQMGLKGTVQNGPDGVLIEIEGGFPVDFIERLRAGAPPLAQITGVAVEKMTQGSNIYKDFRIIESSQDGGFSTPVSADITVCPDCLRELADPEDRRYLYPFINCTNCGPRYSIVKEIPYDRMNTTMAAFNMCPDCKAEYTDPANRRFHAEPVACPACGPSLSIAPELYGNSSKDNISLAIKELKEGGIIAVKGLGGFHLACDASNGAAVAGLRRRKRRGNKPFALMVRSVTEIKKFCHVSSEEEKKLCSPEGPVVLLRKKDTCSLPPDIAPGNKWFGFMLPYTPLHWLLFNHKESDGMDVLVMTSGNISEEPIVIDNDEAIKKLSDIADRFVLHDREIHARVDDSVVYSSPGGHFSFLRRSRGYAPGRIELGRSGPHVMGAGGDLKNTFTLAKDSMAIVSQHIGDMENPRAHAFYLETLDKLKRLFRVQPEAIAYDMHPAYHSSSLALDLDIPEKIAVQHHHAHIASVLAESGHSGKVIGVVLDGTGYGPDGTLWGGEFLIADALDFKRAAHFKPIPLPGGEAAIKEPWRAAIGLLSSAFSKDEAIALALKAGIAGRYSEEELIKVLGIAKRPELSPLSSGAGRLFEAFSSVLGLVDKNTFEAEAAIALESITEDMEGEYDYYIGGMGALDFSMAFKQAIIEKAAGGRAAAISAKFHNTVALAVAETALRLSSETGIRHIALSGGVFHNRTLLEGVLKRFSKAGGIQVLTNRLVPPGDGGISLGQTLIAREKLVK